MKCPPLFVSIEFSLCEDESGNNFRLWVPLFVVVPIAMIILLALLLIALPFMLISLMFTWNTRWWCWLILHIRAMFETFNALPGVEVQVTDVGKEVYIAVH